MVVNEPELSKSGQDYKDLAEGFARTVKDNGEKAPDDVRLGRNAQISKSKVPSLYRGINKNATSIIEGGNENYPVMSYDPNAGSFPNSPRFTKALRDAWPSFTAISNSMQSGYYSDKDEKTILHPCAISNDVGKHLHDFLSTRKAGDSMESMPFSGISSVTKCPTCTDCIDCHRHKEEMVKSLHGLLGKDDGMRLYHAKNLITTLNSWSSHHDSRGGDEDTCEDRRYDGCSEGHKRIGGGLKTLAYKLNRSLEDDYAAAPGIGGGWHRDKGDGDEGEAY